jgi:TRAP-type C4-dicarboxylate transport system permease small subunit
MRMKMVTFDNALDIIITLGFIFMLLCAIMQVLFRYVLQISVPWTEEAARFSLIFVTFWAAATALREKEHISIPTIFEKIPRKPRLLVQMVFIVAIGFFLINVFIGSLKMIKLTWNTPVGSIGWLTTGHVYLSLPSGIILMMIYLIVWMVETIYGLTPSGKEMEKGTK